MKMRYQRQKKQHKRAETVSVPLWEDAEVCYHLNCSDSGVMLVYVAFAGGPWQRATGHA